MNSPNPDPTQPRRRTTPAVIALATMVIALTAACAPVGGPLSAGGPATPTSGATATTPTTEPTTPANPPETTPAPANPPPTAKPAPAPAGGTSIPTCTAAGIAYLAWNTNGAAGSLITTYIVRNQGSATCRLVGVPRLRYAAANGSLTPLPATYDPGTAAILVAAGGQAGFSVREPNGAGGYDPHGPQCAHPGTYHGISAVLSDGSTVALGGTSLSIQCGQFEVAAWHLPPL